MLTSALVPPPATQGLLKPKKVLVIAHGHPDLNKGGGEIAAYNLFQELNKTTTHKAVFMARQGVASAHHGGTPFSQRNADEILFHSEGFDFFKFAQANKRFLWHNFAELLRNYNPDVVHFHHYLHIGIDALRVVRNTLPNCSIVLTLHEYLAICNNQGQMIKTNKKLCYEAKPADCHQCFPNINPTDFFLRELYIKSFFELVDQFIAPSQFLKQRYTDWGLDPAKIRVLENGQVPLTQVTPEKKTKSEKVKFAYFGQLTQFKGVDTLLEAIDRLDRESLKQLELDVHGSGLSDQPEAFQKKINYAFEKHKDIVTFHDSYQPHELTKLMQDVDFVIVPSNWWENSPLVIQEAFKHKKPVICSDIGGMQEKVRDGIDGLHFRAAKPSSLAQILKRILHDPDLQAQLVSNIKEPLTIEESAQEHIKLYNTLELSKKTRAPTKAQTVSGA